MTYTSHVPSTEENVAFNIKFETTNNKINSLTYVQTLISTTTILKEFNHQLGISESLNINVVAERAGSFEVILEAIVTGLNVLNLSSAPTIANLIPLFAQAIEFKKIFSKVDQTKTEEVNGQIILKDNSGCVIQTVERNIYNIYTNPVIDESLASQFESLKNNPEIESFSIISRAGTTTFTRRDFQELSSPTPLLVIEDESISVVDTLLTIAGPYFESRNRAWVFIYQGARISAKVKDDSFWQDVDDGRRFAKGDKLVVSLKIFKEFDNSLGAFLNHRYEVVTVRDHYPRIGAIQPEID